MVVQKAISNLKQGPKEDKVAVASGIAITVVIVLLVAWGILFFKSIQRGSQSVNLSGGAQDEFNFSNVRDAQQKLQEAYSNTTEELRQIREDAAAGQMQFQQQTDMQETQGDEATQFGSGGAIN
jgi:preprotein translocase subunit SecF